MIYLIFCFLVVSCSEDVASKRAANAKKSKSLKIGLSYNEKLESSLLKGVSLALEEVNTGSKEILPEGATLKLNVKDDNSDINLGLTNMAKFSEDIDTIAVIGPTQSFIALPASSIAEFNGILMVTPYATSTKITSNGYKNIFRTIPSDVEIAEEIVDYFRIKKLKKVHLCYVSNGYGKSFADSFEATAESKGLNIVDRISYDVGDIREFNRIVGRWNNYEYDSIMFVGSLPEGINFYKVLDDRAIKVPVVSGEAMVSNDLLDLPEELMKDKLFPSIFHVNDPRYEAANFINKYKEKYGEEPDLLAAVGYDSIKILAKGITTAKSFVPKDIAEALKRMKGYVGVVNTYSFDKNGDLVIEGRLGMQILRDGKFVYIGRY